MTPFEAKKFTQNQCDYGEHLYEITRENFCDRAVGLPEYNLQCDDGSGTSNSDCCELCTQCGNDINDAPTGTNVYCKNEVGINDGAGLIQDVYCQNYDTEWIARPELGAVDVGTTFECDPLNPENHVDFEGLIS